MKWPWTKRETREAGAYTTALVQALLARADGDVLALPGSAACVEMVSGFLSRAFASAELTGPDYATRALSPATLALIARGLVRNGETVLDISVDSDGLRLTPCSEVDLYGTPDPRDWRYRITKHGPDVTLTSAQVSADRVLHFRYAVDPDRPWIGVGPLQSATLGARLAGNLSGALASEAGGEVGRVLALPTLVQKVPEGEVDPVGELKRDLGNLKGGMAIVEQFDTGATGSKAHDWGQQRFGPDPPDALIALHKVATEEILAAYGLAPALFGSGGGTASREAFRQAFHSFVGPIARLVESEIQEKLAAPDFTMSFDRLGAGDLRLRAESFQKLVAGGMDLAKAAALAGLLIADSE